MSEESKPTKPVRTAAELAKRLEAIEGRLDRLLAAPGGAPGGEDEMLLRLVQLEARVAATQRASKTTMWIILIPLIIALLGMIVAVPLLAYQFFQLNNSNSSLQGMLNTQAGQLNGLRDMIGKLNTGGGSPQVNAADIQAILKQLGPALGTLRDMKSMENELLDELAGKKPKRSGRK